MKKKCPLPLFLPGSMTADAQPMKCFVVLHTYLFIGCVNNNYPIVRDISAFDKSFVDYFYIARHQQLINNG